MRASCFFNGLCQGSDGLVLTMEEKRGAILITLTLESGVEEIVKRAGCLAKWRRGLDRDGDDEAYEALKPLWVGVGDLQGLLSHERCYSGANFARS